MARMVFQATDDDGKGENDDDDDHTTLNHDNQYTSAHWSWTFHHHCHGLSW